MVFEGAKKAFLILANGEVFEGKSFGKEGTTIGEIVFTTAMTGYEETLTDPSYCGQIVTQTFPLIGNYGTNSEDYESKRSFVNGYIVREWCQMPSNFRCEENIDEFLKKYGVIGIYDIDTRKLTRIIRETGVMNGMITTVPVSAEDMEKTVDEIKNFKVGKVVPIVSIKEKDVWINENAKYRVALIDYGYKRHIRKELLKRGCEVTLLPWNTTADEILALNPDGIMLSNGPGDPEDNPESIQTLRDLLPHKIPTFGICLGHQLMALANGAKTVKLKYGHRGGNQPVTDLDMDRTFITSQNHGFAVVNESVTEDIGYGSHKNGNDGTCEGVKYKNYPIFTVQFHPEARGGPRDTSYLFDEFVELMEVNKQCR